MSSKQHVKTNRWVTSGTLNNRVIFFSVLFFFSCVMAAQPLQAQVSKTDSLQIANLINLSHEQLIKYNYHDAIRIAQEGLDKSAKLDFKWGIINCQLIIGQAQKSLTNYPASLNHYLLALSEIQKQNDQQMLILANLKIGELFQDWGVPEKALPYYNTALSLQAEKSADPPVTLIERIAEVHLKLNQRDL